MKYQALFNISTVLIFLTHSFIPALTPPAVLSQNKPSQQSIDVFSEIQVLRSASDGLTLALDTPIYNLDIQTLSDSVYDQLTIPNGELWNKPGYPQLPVITGLFGVPAEAEVNVQSSEHSTTLDGLYTLPPGPTAFPSPNDFESGEITYIPDQEVYALDQWLPENPVSIGGEAWIRDQRVMRVTFFPFQYNPAQRTLRWSPYLLAQITFIGGSPRQAMHEESPFADLFAQTLLNADIAKEFRTHLADSNGLSAANAYNSQGPRFDLTVNQDGIYRVTYTALQAAGMDVDNINPNTFHLFNQGQDIAIYVAGEEDNSFDLGDYVTFYGEKFRGDILAERYQTMMDPGNSLPGNNWFWLCVPDTCDLAGAFEQYTDDNIYSLTVGGQAGPRMETLDGSPTGATVPNVYTTTVRAELSNYWYAYDFESEDVWFWSQIQQLTSNLPYTTTYPVNLTAVAPGYPATIHAEVASRVATNGFPDHHTQFRLNPGTSILDDAYWDGQRRYGFTAQVPAEDILEGMNNLLFTMLPDVAAGATRMYFDFYEITYSRLFSALSDQLAFTRYAPGVWQYEIADFTSSTVEVYNITNAIAPLRILNPATTGSGPYIASFKVTDGASASYYVTGSASILSPSSITPYQPPDFASMPEADYLLITHEDFIQSLQPLAAYRASQGLSVAIVDVDDLYREFNDGIYHPIAIKNFLAYTFANWESPPTYVTLVGSGHWNFKNYGAPTEPYANPPAIFMPPNLAYIDPWQGQTDATNLLATIVGDDALPDLNIARLPVSTSAELDVIVGKILAYETQPVQDWQRNITFIADNIPDPAGAGDFVALAENIIADYLDGDPYYQPIRIYENDFGCTNGNTPPCNAVTQAIIDTASITGTLLMNYIGHGSLNRWSGESIFLNEDVALMTNPGQLPIVLSMTCLDGYWIYPNIDSLARVFLISQGKGAVATFSPTGLGVATGHDELQRGFFDALFNQGKWELGRAALQAKVKLFLTDNYFDLLHTYTVFGDPAMHLPTPHEVEVTPDTASQSASPGQLVTYTLGISNLGLVTDTYTITLSGNSWNASTSNLTIGPLPPGDSSNFAVTIAIPPDALGNQLDILTVLAVSHADTNQTDSSTLSTTAITDGLLLMPAAQADSGLPGSTLTYTLVLSNTSNVTDVFTLTLMSGNWVTNLSHTLIPLDPGESQEFQITVEIPPFALGNDWDQVSIVARSANEPAHAALATLHSTAITQGFTLIPKVQSQTGFVGKPVTYSLEIVNLLNTAQYYTVVLSGQQWDVIAPSTVGPANPGAALNFLVSVTIPLTATTGLSDTVMVTVSLLNNPSVQFISTLTTTAQEILPPFDEFYIYMPIIVRP